MSSTPVSAGSETARLLEVYEELERMHAWRGWHWWPDADPFEVMVGCILVQNTNWANVERALACLREADALSPEAMERCSDEELEGLVRSSGQYRQKAKKLRALLTTLRDCGGLDAFLALPAGEARRTCLATWGIGPESADAIVSYASRQPAFVIDAYTRRLFARLGIGPVHSTDYHEWQRFFVGHLNGAADQSGWPLRDLYARYHALIVMHSKHRCRKRAPRCGDCLLSPRCPASVAP